MCRSPVLDAGQPKVGRGADRRSRGAGGLVRCRHELLHRQLTDAQALDQRLQPGPRLQPLEADAGQNISEILGRCPGADGDPREPLYGARFRRKRF